MRKWSKDNCVFVSEENAPSDFKVVWKIKKRRTLDKTSRFYKYEKIYAYDPRGQQPAKNNTIKQRKTNKSRTRKVTPR
jgi:hypothetical protein